MTADHDELPTSDSQANVPDREDGRDQNTEPTPEQPQASGETPIAAETEERPLDSAAHEAKNELAEPEPDEKIQGEAAPDDEDSFEGIVAATVAVDEDLFDSYMREEGDSARDSNRRRPQRGERREATIIQVEKDRVFVDIGGKAEGVIPLAELSSDALESAEGHFNVGDKITVVVIRAQGDEGSPVLSKRRADFEAAWDKIEQAYRDATTISATVVERVKGGLVVDLGVRGFVPTSHVGSGKMRNIDRYVGELLPLKIIDIDRERRKVVLSNKSAEIDRKDEARKRLFDTLKVGDRVNGAVRRLTNYGAFVDLGGVDGLLHISEMSWARITHPKELFKEGQEIEVMVLRLDSSSGKISLGHRQVLPDPWSIIKRNYSLHQSMKVKIGRLVPNGAFVKLDEGAEVFLPLSEMSNRRIRKPEEVVEEGQEVDVQIIEFKPDDRRMVLSMRGVGANADFRPHVREPFGTGDDRRAVGDRRRPKKGRGGREFEADFDESVSRRGFATGGATIGERLGKLKGLFVPEESEEEESPEVVESPGQELPQEKPVDSDGAE